MYQIHGIFNIIVKDLNIMLIMIRMRKDMCLILNFTTIALLIINRMNTMNKIYGQAVITSQFSHCYNLFPC